MKLEDMNVDTLFNQEIDDSIESMCDSLRKELVTYIRAAKKEQGQLGYAQCIAPTLHNLSWTLCKFATVFHIPREVFISQMTNTYDAVIEDNIEIAEQDDTSIH